MLKAFRVRDFKYTGYSQSITLKKGVYLFECWGASGAVRLLEETNNGCDETRGHGGYSKGFIKLNQTTTFFVFVGEKGNTAFLSTFNSNKIATTNGGGATDIRLTDGDWSEFESLKSRIIVAGGGGTGERFCGGDGGGLNSTANSRSYVGSTLVSTPATQTSGGNPGYSQSYGSGSKGAFGISGDGNSHGGESSDTGAGGGGGYYGGGGTPYAGSGSGGSSFISGHPGCDAININSTETHIIHTGQPNHYSGYIFYFTETISGNQYMLSPDHEQVIGHSGDGYARITSFTPLFLTYKTSSLLSSPLTFILFANNS